MPNCWICGDPADSSEHMVKASDFRSIFGHITQKTPAFRHSKDLQNDPIRGANADKLKFPHSLCGYCNNTRTQEHDKAWQRLSEGIRVKYSELHAGDVIPLQRIFPAEIRRSMLNVHLYFVKLLGCYAVEYKVPLPISDFGLCIKSAVANPNLRLIFVSIAKGSTRYGIQVGHINALNIGGKTVSANWFYIIGTFGVAVSYNELGHPRLTQDRGWHPNDVGTRILMR